MVSTRRYPIIDHPRVQVRMTPAGRRVAAYWVTTPYDPEIINALRAVPGARWLRDERTWSVPREQHEALIALLPVIDTRISVLSFIARVEHRLVRNRVAVAGGIIPAGAIVSYWITTPYDEAILEMIKALPSASWLPDERIWSVAARDRAALVEMLPQIDARLAARARTDQEAEAVRRVERVAERAKLEARRDLYLTGQAPDVGTIMRPGADQYGPGADRIVVIEEHGKPWYLDAEDACMHPYRCYGGGRVVYVYHRPATEAEAAEYAQQMLETEADDRAADLLDEFIERVEASEEVINLGRVPDGEVLRSEERSEMYGLWWRLILDGEGRLWYVTYDGSDGGAWGMYNLGYNTRGSSLLLKADEISSLRAACARLEQAARKRPPDYLYPPDPPLAEMMQMMAREAAWEMMYEDDPDYD